MLEALAAIGGGSFVLVSLALGVRLLVLARRTRQLPELAMGLALLLTGGIGYPLTTAALLGEGLPDAVRAGLFAVYMLTQAIGMVALAHFNARVFHPGAPGAFAAVLAVAAGFAATFTGQALGPGLLAGATAEGAAWSHGATGLAVATLGWACVESFRWHLLLRRRAHLGLADPVVADRFRLWGIGVGLAALLSAFATAVALLGIDFRAWAPGALLMGVLGGTAAACVALAFLPPAAYLRRVRERAAAASG